MGGWGSVPAYDGDREATMWGRGLVQRYQQEAAGMTDQAGLAKLWIKLANLR